MSLKAEKTIPRGIRNNNPLNIRKGAYWIGLSNTQDDPEFCKFQTMALGCRAGFRLLRTYIVNRKLNTIRLIISRWAPPSENNTELYIRKVVELTGIPENMVISFYDREIMIGLFDAMCMMEVGQKISRYVVNYGYTLV